VATGQARPIELMSLPTSVGSSTSVSFREALPSGKSMTVVIGTFWPARFCRRAPMVPDTSGPNARPAQFVAV
jgi:hypothetical protein